MKTNMIIHLASYINVLLSSLYELASTELLSSSRKCQIISRSTELVCASVTQTRKPSNASKQRCHTLLFRLHRNLLLNDSSEFSVRPLGPHVCQLYSPTNRKHNTNRNCWPPSCRIPDCRTCPGRRRHTGRSHHLHSHLHDRRGNLHDRRPSSDRPSDRRCDGSAVRPSSRRTEMGIPILSNETGKK